MFDVHSLSTLLTLLKILFGLSLLAEVPVFFFRLLTGRHSFIKDKGGGRSPARALIPDPEWVQAAFEEISQAKQSEQSRARAKSGAVDRRRLILVEVAADGSLKIDIPDHAFDMDDIHRP